MTDTPHFTAVDAYRAVYGARVGEGVSACWMYAPEIAEQDVINSAEFVVDGEINFATLADHINATIAEAVKAEREACAAKVSNFRAHLNFAALMDAMRDEQMPPKAVNALSDLLDGIAAAIRARGAK